MNDSNPDFIRRVCDLAGAARLAAHDGDLAEIAELLVKWQHLHALYHTAMTYDGAHEECECETCRQVAQIRNLYPVE